MPSRRNTWLTFFASLCALLSAIIFTVVVIVHHNVNSPQAQPLVAAVTGIETTTDENGKTQLVVSGSITNQSAEIYGVPDLIIVSHGDDGHVIAQQKFMPSATLLDSGATVNFRHTLSVPVAGVKRVSAKLSGLQVMGDEE